VKELHGALTSYLLERGNWNIVNSPSFPKTPKKLGSELRRHEPSLRRLGIKQRREPKGRAGPSHRRLDRAGEAGDGTDAKRAEDGASQRLSNTTGTMIHLQLASVRAQPIRLTPELTAELLKGVEPIQWLNPHFPDETVVCGTQFAPVP